MFPDMLSFRQRQKWARLNPAFTFENLAVHDGNIEATGVARNFIADPLKYSPLIIYGSSGSGKTYLLHAIGNALAARDPKLRIRCQTSQEFYQHYTGYINKNRNSDFYRYYFNLDVILTDDIQWLQDDEDAQETFFLTMGALAADGKHIAMALDKASPETEWDFSYAKSFLESCEFVSISSKGASLVW